MSLTVGEAAAFLGADAADVAEWVEDEELPARRIRGEYRINRTDLLEWATARGVGVAPGAFALDRDAPTLAAALRAGGIHRGLAGDEIRAVIRRIVPLLPIATASDREALLHVLLARESLGVTLIGDGIAIPHARTPVVLAPAGAALALAFLDAPVDLGLSGGGAADTLFLLVSPTVHVHLAMLARLAFALRDVAFRAAVRERAPAEEIVALAGALEGAFS